MVDPDDTALRGTHLGGFLGLCKQLCLCRGQCWYKATKATSFPFSLLVSPWAEREGERKRGESFSSSTSVDKNMQKSSLLPLFVLNVRIYYLVHKERNQIDRRKS